MSAPLRTLYYELTGDRLPAEPVLALPADVTTEFYVRSLDRPWS
jgi:hypothetical protein